MAESDEVKNKDKKPDEPAMMDGAQGEDRHPFGDLFPLRQNGSHLGGLLTYEGSPAAGASEESRWFKNNNSIKQTLRPGFHFQDVYRDHNGQDIKGVIWVVDPRSDTRLAQQLQLVEQNIGRLQDPKSTKEITDKCEALARYVDSLFSGADGRRPPSESAIAMNRLDLQHGGEKAKMIVLGQALLEGKAVCLQKSLLYKALADQLGLPVTLERGTYGSENHAYNVARLPIGTELIFDVEKREFQGLSKQQATRYERPSSPVAAEPNFSPDTRAEAAKRSLDALFSKPAEPEAAQSLSQQVQNVQMEGKGADKARTKTGGGPTAAAGTDAPAGSRTILPELEISGLEKSTVGKVRNVSGGSTNNAPEGRGAGSAGAGDRGSGGNGRRRDGSDGLNYIDPGDKRPWWERKLSPEERAETPGHRLQHAAVEALKAFLSKHPNVPWKIHEAEQFSPMDQTGHDVLIEIGNGQSLVIDLTGDKSSTRKTDRKMVVEVKDWMLKPVTDANGNNTFEFKDNNVALGIIKQILSGSQQLTNVISTPSNLEELLKANPDENATRDLAHRYIRQLAKRMNWREEAERLADKIDGFFNRLARLPDQPEHRRRHAHKAEELTINTEEHEVKPPGSSSESLDKKLTFEEIDRIVEQHIKEQKEKGNLEVSQKLEDLQSKLRSQPELRERVMAGLVERLGRTGRVALEGIGAATSATIILDFLLEVTGL